MIAGVAIVNGGVSRWAIIVSCAFIIITGHEIIVSYVVVASGEVIIRDGVIG